MEKITLGIDFGTCYSSAAYYKDGILVPVKDTAGGSYQTTIPSAVFFQQDGTCVVGQGAISLMAQDPESFFQEFKRSIGTSHGYSCKGKRIEAWQLVAEILMKIKKEAERTEGKIEKFVLTVPATYNQAKKDVMLKAAKEVGFKAVKIMAEPVAAAIYWQTKNKKNLSDGDITLVYDLGGGTFDTVLVKKQGENYEFVGTPAGDDAIGGLAFDGRIFEDLEKKSTAVGEFMASIPAGVDQEAIRLRFGQALQDFCREFKHRLSERDIWSNYLPLVLGIADKYTLSQDQFRRLIGDYIDKTMDVCDAVVKESGFSWKQVAQILLVGGSTRIPYVKEALEHRFRRPVERCDEPDMAVCYGAALFKEVGKREQDEFVFDARHSDVVEQINRELELSFQNVSSNKVANSTLKDGSQEILRQLNDLFGSKE